MVQFRVNIYFNYLTSFERTQPGGISAMDIENILFYTN